MASTNTDPHGPLRAVVASSQKANYRLDRLECGHEVADYDNHQRLRRRCAECKREGRS